MAHFRLPELDLSNRVALAAQMLQPDRPWGLVTALANHYDVSRTFLYQLRDTGQQLLIEGLRPQSPGPRPATKVLVVDEPFVQRAIVTLPLVNGTVRGIQQGLDLLFQTHCALGYIDRILQAAGIAAAAQNAQYVPSQPILAEADEIFQGRRPTLTLVDGRSFLVVHLSAAEARDATTWGVTLLDEQQRGIQFHDIVCDDGGGLQAGLKEAELQSLARWDLFHLLREPYRLRGQLERAAYKAIGVAERARQAEQEAQAPKRRGGRPRKSPLPRMQAEAQETAAIDLCDLWAWLLGEVRLALAPTDAQGQVRTVAPVRAELETAIALMRMLAHDKIAVQAQKLSDHLDELLAPLAWLEQQLAPWRKVVDADTETFLVWAWQHREALHLEIEREWAQWQPAEQAIWQALQNFHRASSLAEALHSWLRSYLQVHRSRPQWLLALLELFWNHHTFQRGKRAGQSPLQLAGVSDAPSLSQALDQVLNAAFAGQAI